MLETMNTEQNHKSPKSGILVLTGSPQTVMIISTSNNVKLQFYTRFMRLQKYININVEQKF